MYSKMQIGEAAAPRCRCANLASVSAGAREALLPFRDEDGTAASPWAHRDALDRLAGEAEMKLLGGWGEVSSSRERLHTGMTGRGRVSPSAGLQKNMWAEARRDEA